METQSILRAVYTAAIRTDDVEEIRAAVRAMMDEKDVAYVEKIIIKRKGS